MEVSSTRAAQFVAELNFKPTQLALEFELLTNASATCVRSSWHQAWPLISTLDIAEAFRPVFEVHLFSLSLTLTTAVKL